MIDQVSDFQERTLGRLLSQFKGKVRIEALLTATATVVQELEDLFIGQLLNESEFDVAAGVHLEAWGKLVGEQRGGLLDEDYRRFISAKILANKCLGRTDEFIRIFDLVTGDSEVRENKLLWLGFELYTYRQSGDDLSDDLKSRIFRMLESIRPDGVNMTLVEVPFGYFGFEEDPDALGYDVGLFAWEIS